MKPFSKQQRSASGSAAPALQRILAVCLLVLCLNKGARAGLLDEKGFGKGVGDKEQPVIIYARKLEYDRRSEQYHGEGYVDIRYGDLCLQADQVDMNTSTGLVTAQGNVILDEKNNRITGERMEVDLNTRLGTIYQGAGYVEAGYYFTGEKIERVALDEFIIYRGSYTSCDQPLPDWALKASKCRLHIENYAYLSHFTMNIKDIPVLYCPYGVFPIKTKRSSGFLIPRIGYSSQDGFTLKNSYFWAVNEWSDLTYGVDYFGERGVGQALEGRYALTKADKGRFNAYHIRDEITLQERWQLKGDIQQQLPHNIQALGSLDTFSDRLYDQQLSDDLQVRNRQEQESLFSLTRNWDNFHLSLWGNYSEDLYQDKETIQQRLPELQFNALSQRLGESPFFFEWETSASALEKRMDSDLTMRTQRLNFHPRISLPWKLREGVVITPSVGWWDTWYSDTTEGERSTRNLYDIKISLDGPQVYRTFTVNRGGLKGLKHLFYPNITYKYIPYEDQARLLQYDGLDKVAREYKVEYSLTSHLLGKFQEEGREEATVRDLLTVTLSQTYDIAEERRLTGLKTTPRRPFSELKLDVECKPQSYLRVDYESYFNVYDTYVDRINIDAWLTPPGGFWSFSGGWRYAKLTGQRSERTDALRGSGTLQWGSWRLDGALNYDLWAKERIECSYQLRYFSQCWSIALVHITRPQEEIYSLVIDFKGLGTIGQQ